MGLVYQVHWSHFYIQKPVNGVISQEFLPAIFHYGIDISYSVESPLFGY